jgi:PilZ domain-containing protein
MAILHIRSIERRRTARAAMSMRLVVSGERADGQKFKFWTRTESVSRHGGMMVLSNLLDEGQQIELLNEFNHKKARVRVVAVKRSRDGQVHATFEFVEGEENFWSMTFPAAGARPLRKWTARENVATS